MWDFKLQACNILLNNDYDQKDYDIPLDLVGAYKALKQYINKPIIVH